MSHGDKACNFPMTTVEHSDVDCSNHGDREKEQEEEEAANEGTSSVITQTAKKKSTGNTNDNDNANENETEEKKTTIEKPEMEMESTQINELSSDLSNLDIFEWKRKLADTLQGEIWLALNKITNEYVTIKVASKECVKNQISKSNVTVRENFPNERKIQTLLSHYVTNRNMTSKDSRIGFVTCQGTYEDDTNYYLVMEYCKGGELLDHVNAYYQSAESNKDPEKWIKQVQYIFQQMVFGVSFMHYYNIAHQDLSMENILFFDLESLYVKIIDFGMAIHVNDKEKRKGRIGKMDYMSPECFDKEEYDPFANDLWCLGVILYMMLTGSHPPIRDKRALHYKLNGLDKTLTNQSSHPLYAASLDCLKGLLKSEANRMNLNKLLRDPFVRVNGPLNSLTGCIQHADNFISNWRTLVNSNPSTSQIRTRLMEGQRILSKLEEYQEQLSLNDNNERVALKKEDVIEQEEEKMLSDEQVTDPSINCNGSATSKEIQLIKERIGQLTSTLNEINHLLSPCLF